ncbi:HAD family phosphatase [Candidatus Binatia bacterium]|nr:HAD family phosphatase [Candidatus Binatia bacterium]
MRKTSHPIPRLRDISAVIFDLDGVLVDSEPLHFRAANRVLGGYGHAITEPEYVRFIGLGERATWEAWRRQYALAAPVEALVEKHTAARRAEIDAGVEPIGPAVTLAARLAATGVRLAIASSSTREIIEALLRALGVDDLFGVLVSGEDPGVTRSKPAPDVYLEAARRLGVAASACLAIEDSAPGVAAATAAGMVCVAVPGRWTRHQDFGAADVVLASLDYFPLIVS